MKAEFDFSGDVVLATGVGGALGSSVAEAFLDAGATVCGVDLVDAGVEDVLLDDPGRIGFYQGDFTDESQVILSDRICRNRDSLRGCLSLDFPPEPLSEVHVLLSDSMSGTVAEVVDTHGGLDAFCNIAGTWRGEDLLVFTAYNHHRSHQALHNQPPVKALNEGGSI